MGPSAIRYANLAPALEALDYTVHDCGNVAVPLHDHRVEVGDPLLRYLDPIVRVAQQVADATSETTRSGRFALTLGGDHSMALGSIRGVSDHKKIGVIWIDAHGDFNTVETTPSGNVHGMVLAALCGLGDERLAALGRGYPRAVNPTNVAIVGARQLDPGERVLLKQAGVHVFAMEQLDRIGMYEAMQRAIEAACRGTDGLYFSLDLDSLDPVYAPGVGTPVPGGLTYRETHLACELIAETGKLCGMDVVEVNPILDERNRTAQLAVELTCSALGMRVWP
jgi:arginase